MLETVCGDISSAFPALLAFQFCCTFLWGSLSTSVLTSHLAKPLPTWDASPLSFFVLLPERGSMSCGSHLFGQCMLITAWHQTVYLQPYAILRHCLLWNSCFLLDELVILLILWRFTGWQLFPLPLKLFIPQVAAAGDD